jgi:DNA-binding CsgD family transcriptional regulator
MVDGLRRFGERIGDMRLSPLGGALRRLFPEWEPDLPPALEPLDDPQETRHRLYRAIAELVERLGVDVLVVEDAHWSDAATLEWLLMLTAAETAGLGMSVVVTYRPLEVAEGSLLLRLTSRPPASMRQVRVGLEPLDVEQTRALVGSMFGTDHVSEGFASFLHERTDGLPLALEECVRLLRDREDIVERAGRWSRRHLEKLEVPPTVRDSVLERVGRLDLGARQVLEAAAALAQPAEEGLLASVAGLDDAAARSGVAAALATGLLREAEPDTYVFRHVLDAQAVDGSIPASERRRLHRRAAEVLQQLDPEPVARLSRHCREANDVDAWCHYAEASADLALESGNDRAAVTVLLELLVDVEHPVERRTRLARKLGDAAFVGTAALGNLADRVVDALRAALTTGVTSPSERGEIRLLLGRMLREVSEEPAAYAEIEASIADFEDRPDLALRAMMNLAMPLVPGWPASQHLAWLERATALLPQLDSTVDRLSFMVNRATAFLLLGEEAGWQAIDEIPRSAASPVELRVIGRGQLNAAELAVVWGRYGDVRPLLAAALEYLHDGGYHKLTSTVRVTEAHLDWYTGDWVGLDEAVAELADSEESLTLDQLQARQILGALDFVHGARDQAERRLTDVTADYARLGVVDPIAVLATGTLARLHLVGGAADEALRVTERDIGMIVRKGVWLWATDAAPVRADALVEVGRLDHAEVLTDQFAEGLAGRSAPAPAAALKTCRAIVAEGRGDLSRAAGLFADAAGEWAALPRPYDELLAVERHGRCLLAIDEPDKGLAVLSDVQQRLRSQGSRWDADRVAKLLRQHGVTVARAWAGGRRSYGDQLSPRELEVVRLVASGLTNRQIAEALFLAPKTVARHLSRAMQKLGVTSRTALAMTAAETGLLDSLT